MIKPVLTKYVYIYGTFTTWGRSPVRHSRKIDVPPFPFSMSVQTKKGGRILMTDQEIINLCRNGQKEEAFNAIIADHSERLYWHVRRFLCSHEETDDLLQEIFIKVWASLPSFRGDSRLYTWLYRIATNETLNYLHKQKIRSALKFESLTAEMENKIDNDPWFNGNHLQRILAKTVQKLPEKQRLVFSMRYYEDLPYEDISEILGTSVGALKASYHFASEKIKEEIKKYIA